jgi:hypothetical protein
MGSSTTWIYEGLDLVNDYNDVNQYHVIFCVVNQPLIRSELILLKNLKNNGEPLESFTTKKLDPVQAELLLFML